MSALIFGVAWTLLALVVAWICSIIAGLTNISWGGIGRMIWAFMLVFMATEIGGFVLYGALF